MKAIAIATRNAHKVREIQEILNGDFRCLGLNDFPGAPPVHEDAPTFSGNAVKKAVSLANWIQKNRNPVLKRFPEPCTYILADDSGLEVDALGGAPGVHSARFAADETGASNAPDAANNKKLLNLLQEVPGGKRTARFRCVLALVRVARDEALSHEITEKEAPIFEGACEGRIALAPSGGGGFGYDPLFVPDGHTKTFAELGDDVKNAISHRSIALRELLQFLSHPARVEGDAASLD